MPRMVAEGVETINPILVKDIILSGSATGFPTIAGSEMSPVNMELNSVENIAYRKIAETILTPGNYSLKMIVQCDAGTTGEIRIYNFTGKQEIYIFEISNTEKQVITKQINYAFGSPDNIVECHVRRLTGDGSINIGSIKIEKTEE